MMRTSELPSSLLDEHLQMRLLRLVSDEIAPSRRHPGLYDCPFELHALPQASWALAFKAAYQEIDRSPKRDVRLAGGRIIAVVLPSDDLQHVADTVRHALEQTNALFKEADDRASAVADEHRRSMKNDEAILLSLQEDSRHVRV
jgi:hypothetical protein